METKGKNNVTSESFQHHVITRFNNGIYNPNNSRKIADNTIINQDPDGWMEHRFDIFDTFFFPSILYQVNKNFTLDLLYDNRTPEKYVERLREYERIAQSKGINLVLCDFGYKDLTNSLKTCMEQTGCKCLVTTRLDNDDAVSKQFIQAIQNKIKFDSTYVVNMKYGYVLNLRAGRYKKGLHEDMHTSNPFCSLVENVSSVEEIKTIIVEKHGSVANLGKVFQLLHGRHWMQVIHRKNALNFKASGRLVDAKVLNENYNISIDWSL